MALPAVFFYKWSDAEEFRANPRTLQPPLVAHPRELQDVELQLWATYPDEERKGKAKKRSGLRVVQPRFHHPRTDLIRLHLALVALAGSSSSLTPSHQ